MAGGNYDVGNYPRSLWTLMDHDVQERRLHKIMRDQYAVLDELRRLEGEVMPVRIATSSQSSYDTQIDAAKAGAVAIINAVKAIDALPNA